MLWRRCCSSELHLLVLRMSVFNEKKRSSAIDFIKNTRLLLKSFQSTLLRKLYLENYKIDNKYPKYITDKISSNEHKLKPFIQIKYFSNENHNKHNKKSKFS